MNLKEKSLKVNEIFNDLDMEVQDYLAQSQLTCLSGCGKCCANPKVPATVLEFLPLAFDLYQKGQAEALLDQLETATEDSYCVVLKLLSADGAAGHCTQYNHRGLICRLFGNSSRRNREGKKELITCKNIKEQKQQQFQIVTRAIQNDLEIPGSSDYYTRLSTIDFHMAEQQFPINIAIKKAIEAVLSFYFYFEGQAV
ncbi:YkgJ family cysteine cluster protein [Echinicola sp. CAU 1574]|uniref:YkgJ family cysteine cluster protein n=1 Tax=Echinicola arenosa TaxID=2774144 RepID=A0ABR9ATZ2_9BACT|nr:YkgJ family cysteine cluster protein [Echinicola arenosa]MBD8491059.1 YkgJ family cysteine cluster protein [Echinicola arenosa]